MKITKVEVFRLPTANSKQNSPIGCRIHTDVGICGDGEAGMAYGVGGSGAFGMVCDLAELIIGMDPLRTEFIWETMYKRTFWGQNGGPVVFSGIAAIDVALWDIKGKYFNVPCYQLLGGKVRDKLRTYASQLQFGWGQVGVSEHLWAVTPADYAHNVKLALDEGFDAIKIDFFDRDEEGKPLNFLDTTGLLTPKQLKMVESRMKAAREAAGDDVDIIMENHSYPDALGAVQLAKLAEKYNIMAFEEPNTPTTQTVEYIAKYSSVPMLCDLSSPRTSGVFAYMYLTQCLSLSLFGASAAAYLGDIIPALNSHWARVIVGVTLLTFFYVVNLMGVDIMAKAQKMMTWLLIAALILFAIVGIFKMKLPIFDFSDPSFAINGWGITFNNGQISGGFLGAVLLFVYSTQGYYMTTAYGRDSKNARKDIPFVLLLCVPTLCILYVGVAMAGVGVMSVEEYGNSTTLVFAAQRIFPTWLFYFFIIGGPIMALLSTLNSSFAYNSITIGQSCDDGWLPKSFGKKNKSGARPYILTFMYVVGIIPIVFGLSITTITNMVQLITSAFAILNFTAEIKMPKKYPDAWKQSRYHVPDGLYYTICCVSLALFLVVLWKSLLSMNIGLAVINVVVIVIAGLIGFWRSKTGNIEIHTSVWAEDYQEAAES